MDGALSLGRLTSRVEAAFKGFAVGTSATCTGFLPRDGCRSSKLGVKLSGVSWA